MGVWGYHLLSSKLQFLALKWAICKTFCDYWYYAPTFTVYTDNNPLTNVSPMLGITGLGNLLTSTLTTSLSQARSMWRPTLCQGFQWNFKTIWRSAQRQCLSGCLWHLVVEQGSGRCRCVLDCCPADLHWWWQPSSNGYAHVHPRRHQSCPERRGVNFWVALVKRVDVF